MTMGARVVGIVRSLPPSKALELTSRRPRFAGAPCRRPPGRGGRHAGSGRRSLPVASRVGRQLNARPVRRRHSEQLTRILLMIRWSRIASRREPLSSVLQIIGWWELRRPLDNLAVGLAGGICLLLVASIAFVSDRLVGEPFGVPDPAGLLLLAIAAYGLAANFFYTGGWVAELVALHTWPREAGSFATRSFALGLLGSVLLTLLLGGLVALASAVAFVIALAGRRTLQIVCDQRRYVASRRCGAARWRRPRGRR